MAKYNQRELMDLFLKNRLTDQDLKDSGFRIDRGDGIKFIQLADESDIKLASEVLSIKENRLLGKGVKGRPLEFLLQKKQGFSDMGITEIKRLYYDHSVLDDKLNPNSFPISDFVVMLGSGAFKEEVFKRSFRETKTKSLEEIYFDQIRGKDMYKFCFSEQGIYAMDANSLLKYFDIAYDGGKIKPSLLKMIRYIASERFKVNVDIFMNKSREAIDNLHQIRNLEVQTPLEREFIGFDSLQDEDWFLHFDNFGDILVDLQTKMLNKPNLYPHMAQKYTMLSYFVDLPDLEDFVKELFSKNLHRFGKMPAILLSDEAYDGAIREVYDSRIRELEGKDPYFALNVISHLETNLNFSVSDIRGERAKHHRQVLSGLRLESVKRLTDEQFATLSRKPNAYNGLPEIRNYVLNRFKLLDQKEYNNRNH